MHPFASVPLRSTARAFLVVTASVLSAFAAEPKTFNASSGLYGLLPTNVATTDSRVTDFLAHSDFVGVSVRTYWRDLEPTQDNYDWSYYDNMIATAKAAGKKVILRLEAAWASPQWVLTAVTNAGGPLYDYYEKHEVEGGGSQGGPGDQKESMPAPWDATYLAHWADFVADMGARYNGNPTVAAVLISGCSRSTEMYLPSSSAPDSGPDWYAAPFNYTPQKLIDAWTDVIDMWVTAFPNKPAYLSVSAPLANDGVVEAVAAYGASEYPWHFCGKISYWNNTNSPTHYPTAALLAIADEYTHGGLEPAGAAAGDINSTAISNAISWHMLGAFEVYYAQRNNFATLRSAIDARRTMIERMTFTATPASGQVALAWTIGSPNPYVSGIRILRKTGDFPAGMSDASATLVYDGNASGTATNTGLTNGTRYYYAVYDEANAYTIGQAAVTPGTTAITLNAPPSSAHDGWILESSETSETGGSLNNSSGLQLGDDASDRQYRVILSFDTSSIPLDATIVSATLKLKRSSVSGTNPFTTHGTAHVDICSGAFSLDPALGNADFDTPASVAQVAAMSNAASNGALSTGTLNFAGISAINRTGVTQFRVYFATDDNDDAGADYVSFYSANNGTASNRPVLEIVYR